MKQKMQTHFQGLIELLAKSLYPEPGVYLRELIQNAHDAIQLRKQSEPSLSGRICIDTEEEDLFLVIRDNGLGMGRSDIEDFLSTIGASGTKKRAKELLQKNPEQVIETIGRFGIGFLSSFAAAEHVEVTTRKLGSDTTYQWTSYGDGLYEIVELDDEEFEVGTQIRLQMQGEKASHVDGTFLRQLVKRYVDFLPFPIVLNDNEILNRMTAPWYTDQDLHSAAYLQELALFVEERFSERPLLVIPVSLTAPKVVGVLYVSAYSTSGGYRPGAVDVFQRRIGLKMGEGSMLPSWASFVRGVIDSPDLTPTAARDNLQQDDVYHEVCEKLAQLLRESLLQTQVTAPDIFKTICHRHGHQLKSAVLRDQDLFDAFIERLPFETSLGSLSLEELIAPQKLLRATQIYLLTGQPRSILELCRAKGLLAIRCTNSIDEQLLRLLASRREGALSLLQPSKELDLLAPLPEEGERFIPLVRRLSQVLARFGLGHVGVEVRSFLPAELESLLLQSEVIEERKEKLKEVANNLGSSRAALFDEIVQDTQQALAEHTAMLFLNAENPSVQRLLGGASEQAMLAIYTTALLRTGAAVTREQRSLLVMQLQALLNG